MTGGRNNEIYQEGTTTNQFSVCSVALCSDTDADCMSWLFQVEKLGRDSFFFLTKSFPFDEMSFGELTDTVNTRKPMLVSRAVSYVFDLHPPTDIQFGYYAAVLHKYLHDN